MVDNDVIDEQLFDLYVIYCEKENTSPSMSDFKVWKDENFD